MTGFFRAMALFALGIILAGQANANLIQNGTFDTDASGWILGGTGVTPATFEFTRGNPSGSVLINAAGEVGSDPTAAQTVSGLTIGATYILQWDEIWQGCGPPVCGGSGFGKTFGVFLDNEPGNPIALNEFLDANWHTLTQTFVATATGQTIIFAAELDTRTPGVSVNSDISYYIDNVSLNPVPEPETYATMLAGLGLLGWIGRSRKQNEAAA